jgi:hypothetical protein
MTTSRHFKERAIYFQLTKSSDLEFTLVKIVTRRDFLLSTLSRMIRDVNSKLRLFDGEFVFETFFLMNQLRDETFALGEAVNQWIKGYTKVVRPFINETDYVVNMIDHIDLMNGIKLRRLFDFNFGKGNVLLLPSPLPRAIKLPIRKINMKLAREIEKFAAPSEDLVIKFYKTMKMCLPGDMYRNLYPIKSWMGNPWFPQVEIVDTSILVELNDADAAICGLDSGSITSTLQSNEKKLAAPNLTEMRQQKGKKDLHRRRQHTEAFSNEDQRQSPATTLPHYTCKMRSVQKSTHIKVATTSVSSVTAQIATGTLPDIPIANGADVEVSISDILPAVSVRLPVLIFSPTRTGSLCNDGKATSQSDAAHESSTTNDWGTNEAPSTGTLLPLSVPVITRSISTAPSVFISCHLIKPALAH